MAVGDDRRLPCGVALQDLLAQVTDGLAPADAAHQAGCAHCREALAQLRRAWREVEAVARLPVAIPSGLSGQIMRQIRSLQPHRGGGATVLDSGRGVTRVGEPVLRRIAHRAALEIPGVAFASSVTTGEDAGGVRLGVRLVILFGPVIEVVAEAVRGRIVTRVSAVAGVEVAAVDVSIEDILSDEQPTAA